MNRINSLVLLSLICLGSCLSATDDKDKKYSTLVWSDEFDYSGVPDTTKWTYDLGDGCPNNCGWGNNELQQYTSDAANAYVEDGKLIIVLRQDSEIDSLFTSARLLSTGNKGWKYGRFEFRAKLPSALGTWSALWMLPSEWIYGGWPHSGEIDIMENVGYDPDSVVSATHTGMYNGAQGTQKHTAIAVPDCDTAFHNYILEWDEDEYRVYVDENLFFTYQNENKSSAQWPYDQRFRLLMNIAFGGNWGGLKGIDPTALPVKMEVDYVRVYQ
ncbi:Glycosyl hydrolases family 16 [Reichenbachiella agariperforans]|uniref:Glycosyl hydrolases family 16 n=1 Tax=Reichenbachiella agariperforans TaxID=156994 RepID=A0A1M6Q0S7_REIAG|nr:glycoside hydrolase family 16 protein [Reichenbachiella agariperforans]SHK13763.1 Glycosyl hydrolases family 16 [Reichenbachiella agariperforans]